MPYTSGNENNFYTYTSTMNDDTSFYYNYKFEKIKDILYNKVVKEKPDGGKEMEYIGKALSHITDSYDIETMTFTDGSLKGIKFFDKLPERGDFCIDISNQLILFCIESARRSDGYNRNGFFVGFNDPEIVTDVNSRYIIPIETNDSFIVNFFNNNPFIGNAYRYTERAVKARYPDFISCIKTKTCPHCGLAIKGNNSYRVGNDIFCEDCYRELYRQCERCGDTFRINDANKMETLCPECAKREFVLPYHRYAPPLDFYGNNHNNTVPYLGVELEVDEGGESDRNVKQLMKLINPKDKHFVYCSHDGSLREGFEIITQPATLKYHTSIKGVYEQMFQFLLKKGYLSHDTATCGIHVHFNRNFYEENEELYITRLLYLVDKFWDEIVRFSRRNQRRLDRYSKKVDCPPTDYYKRSNKSGNHDYHYYAINLANENTIEFRMFKGSLNIDTFMATLQFVHNCIVCAKEKTAEEIQHMEFEELITGRACKAYWKNRKNRVNTEE